MAKLVAISGAQGAGKSTLLNALRKKSWIVDDFKVSRSVQKQLGWASLDRVMDDIESMKTFQQEVLHQKYKNDLAVSQNSKEPIVLTERSFADIAAYTTFWCWEHAERSNWELTEAAEWLSLFVRQCHQHQRLYSAILLLPYHRQICWDSDPNRANAESVETIYGSIYQFVDRDLVHGIKFKEIQSVNIDQRVDEAEELLCSV